MADFFTLEGDENGASLIFHREAQDNIVVPIDRQNIDELGRLVYAYETALKHFDEITKLTHPLT